MYYDHNFIPCTNPTTDCLYVKILKQLIKDGEQSKAEIYGAIPGTEYRDYGYCHKWVNWGILTALVKHNYVSRGGNKYKITTLGRTFIKKAAEANAI